MKYKSVSWKSSSRMFDSAPAALTSKNELPVARLLRFLELAGAASDERSRLSRSNLSRGRCEISELFVREIAEAPNRFLHRLVEWAAFSAKKQQYVRGTGAKKAHCSNSADADYKNLH